MNSARSERRLNDWLNEDFQFILRKEVPDKGCDYMGELLEGSGATNLKFPVQLKSIQQPEFVSSGTYISYPMLTSRLGYMLNLLPTTGIIVLYSVEANLLYYDFSDKVFQRIKDDRSTDDWVQQDYVNIRIPVSNCFTPEVMQDLHITLMKRFDNAARMQTAYGERYELPVVEILGTASFDFNNKEHLKRTLKEFGLALLTRFDLAPVFNSLTQFTQQEIESDKELLMLACVAYGETGHFSQSDLFIKKLKRNFTLNETEGAMVSFAECKNLMQLGQLTAAQFIQRQQEITLHVKDLHNQLIIRINLQRLQVMEIKEPHPAPPAVTVELENIFTTIDNSSLDLDVKDILTIWNAEQESHLLTHQLHLDFLSYTLSRTVNRELPMDERRQMIHRFMNSETAFLKRVDTVYRRAFDKQNKYIMASALSLLAMHFILKLFCFISQGAPLLVPEEQHKKFFGFAFQGFQLFSEISQLKDAHYCLCNALEIMYSAKYYNNAGVEDDMKNLLEQKDQLEKHLLLEPYTFQIPILVEKVYRNAETEIEKSLAGLSDNQIEQLARTMFAPFRLPQERFIHLLNELRATQLFQQRCHDPNIVLLTYGVNASDPYREPVSFFLKNKNTGLESLPSVNMGQLLTSWGF